MLRNCKFCGIETFYDVYCRACEEKMEADFVETPTGKLMNDNVEDLQSKLRYATNVYLEGFQDYIDRKLENLPTEEVKHNVICLSFSDDSYVYFDNKEDALDYVMRFDYCEFQLKPIEVLHSSYVQFIYKDGNN